MLSSDFEKTLLQQNLISPKDKILIACSGGPDSIALVHLLMAIRGSWKLKIGIAHFNHQLRGRASREDAAFVRRLAKKIKFPFYAGAARVKKTARGKAFSLEEAARHLRYEFLCKTARRYGYAKVATAHTRNDQAETILMRMAQGTGLRGLCGIRPEVSMDGTTVVRPLLFFMKAEILDFLKESKIAYREDASNASERFVRNKIRHKILPLLERELNPKIIQALSRIPAILNAESETLDGLEAKVWKQGFKGVKKGKAIFHRRALLGLSEALQFRLIDRALKQLDTRSGINYEAWQKIRELLRKGRGRHSLPKDIDFELTLKAAVLYKKISPVALK